MEDEYIIQLHDVSGNATLGNSSTLRLVILINDTGNSRTGEF